MPAPGEALARDARRTRAGRWQMLLLALVCAAPVIASYFSYYVIRPQGRTNYGELIDPQRPMPALQATDLAGQAVDLDRLKGQWLLISVAGGACDAECESNLYLERQLHESLGKNRDRMDWVWLVDDDQPVRDALRPALREAKVLRVSRAALAQWLQPAAGQRLEEHLYVVDPLGHWMMRFPARLDKEGASKARHDLERLMRASAGWDTAGRDAPAAK
ncbi:MAG: hypothetical protein R3E52_09705 [Burkholderiaceae bacterium]